MSDLSIKSRAPRERSRSRQVDDPWVLAHDLAQRPQLIEVVDLSHRIGAVLRVPSVRLVPPEPASGAGGVTAWLEWTLDAETRFTSAEPGDCLDDFIRLHDATPERVLDFARAWGVLGICLHGKPASHLPGCAPLGLEAPLDPSVAFFQRGWEPIEAWLRYARQLRAALRVIHDTARGLRGRREDWDAIAAGSRPLGDQVDPTDPTFIRDRGYSAPSEPTVAGDRTRIADFVSLWIEYAQLRPVAHWFSSSGSAGRRHPLQDRPLFVLQGSPDLIGRLAFDLAGAFASSVHMCTFCGEPFARTANARKPRSDKRIYCPKCRNDGVPGREASKRWWREHKSAGTTG